MPFRARTASCNIKSCISNELSKMQMLQKQHKPRPEGSLYKVKEIYLTDQLNSPYKG